MTDQDIALERWRWLLHCNGYIRRWCEKEGRVVIRRDAAPNMFAAGKPPTFQRA